MTDPVVELQLERAFAKTIAVAQGSLERILQHLHGHVMESELEGLRGRTSLVVDGALSSMRSAQDEQAASQIALFAKIKIFRQWKTGTGVLLSSLVLILNRAANLDRSKQSGVSRDSQ